MRATRARARFAVADPRARPLGAAPGARAPATHGRDRLIQADPDRTCALIGPSRVIQVRFCELRW